MDNGSNFKNWFEAIWLGDEECGQFIPNQKDEDYDEYLEKFTLSYGAYKYALSHSKERIAELEKEAKRPVPYHKVVEALTLMAWQYLENHDGFIDHQYMSAGEATTEVLEKLGIIQDDLILEKFKEDGYFEEAMKGSNDDK